MSPLSQPLKVEVVYKHEGNNNITLWLFAV